ncbi:NADH dehydrogenase ubiquinone Fe-S protein 4 [Bradyrhizobium elkanii]|uniref:NADH dehydrogenase ubiquinone Fe-S protein 4 n=1 Tax=Bradyrhizobium elkanii TaxID=29448 RepID=UPI003513CEAC
MPANARSTFPADAQAVIYRVARSVMTSAPRRKEEWKLKFERRTPLSIEPLMGWTEDEDPLAQLELSFPSAEAAIAYARGQELQYLLLDRPARDQDPGLVSPHGVPAGPAAPDLRRTSETLMRAAPRTITRRMMPFPRISDFGFGDLKRLAIEHCLDVEREPVFRTSVIRASSSETRLGVRGASCRMRHPLTLTNPNTELPGVPVRRWHGSRAVAIDDLTARHSVAATSSPG